MDQTQHIYRLNPACSHRSVTSVHGQERCLSPRALGHQLSLPDVFAGSVTHPAGVHSQNHAHWSPGVASERPVLVFQDKSLRVPREEPPFARPAHELAQRSSGIHLSPLHSLPPHYPYKTPRSPETNPPTPLPSSWPSNSVSPPPSLTRQASQPVRWPSATLWNPDCLDAPRSLEQQHLRLALLRPYENGRSSEEDSMYNPTQCGPC